MRPIPKVKRRPEGAGGSINLIGGGVRLGVDTIEIGDKIEFGLQNGKTDNGFVTDKFDGWLRLDIYDTNRFGSLKRIDVNRRYLYNKSLNIRIDAIVAFSITEKKTEDISAEETEAIKSRDWIGAIKARRIPYEKNAMKAKEDYVRRQARPDVQDDIGIDDNPAIEELNIADRQQELKNIADRQQRRKEVLDAAKAQNEIKKTGSPKDKKVSAQKIKYPKIYIASPNKRAAAMADAHMNRAESERSSVKDHMARTDMGTHQQVAYERPSFLTPKVNYEKPKLSYDMPGTKKHTK